MILLIRDNECFEPRVQNYLKYFRNNNIPYKVIAWNRNGTAKLDDNIIFFEKRAEYGKRIKNIPNKLAWMAFALKNIFKLKKDITFIHTCDIDAAIPGLLCGKLIKKKVVFDIFDWVTPPPNGKGAVYKIIDFCQNYCFKHSDAVILCEEERKVQASAQNNNIWVLPNIPSSKFEFDDSAEKTIKEEQKNFDLTISYVGVFDHSRGLENMVKAVKECPNVLFNLAGFGILEDELMPYINSCDNIHFWGRVDYETGQTIMKNSDLIVAMYYLTNEVHRFAAPNKYYESLYLNKPLLTSENTLVAAKVEKHNTGFVLDETIESIINLFKSENLKSEITAKSQNCENIWLNKYKNYFNSFMNDTYLKFYH